MAHVGALDEPGPHVLAFEGGAADSALFDPPHVRVVDRDVVRVDPANRDKLLLDAAAVELRSTHASTRWAVPEEPPVEVPAVDGDAIGQRRDKARIRPGAVDALAAEYRRGCTITV